MSKRIHILVEGQTEETFVKEVLTHHLWEYEIFPNVTMVCTRVVRNVRANRGGISDYSKIKRDLSRLCQDTNVVGITTLFDFYALPSDVPGMNSLPQGNCYEQVEHVEQSLQRDIADPRFIPFIMLHEFEAIIYCDPQKLEYAFPNNQSKLQRIINIAQEFDSPEEINSSPQTAPSKRIISVFPEYDKVLHGCTTALEIGIAQIRSKCPHFDIWIRKLESL
ncbi:hypothetical protein PN4B1_48360 [Paenibacillus naphthalenovorans]|uniref:DUF4276 family protein n=1 Tax=Paenibacillus naphthalenovorans TaxID=162209 RepID=UPI0010B9CDF4|nr:DUF4276 family protein [Paenibacillus naphthalenovorans]GCL74854.1 hypothetical protein PN4B1_48360 [Paenibacillus naphthalenovorans]